MRFRAPARRPRCAIVPSALISSSLSEGIIASQRHIWWGVYHSIRLKRCVVKRIIKIIALVAMLYSLTSFAASSKSQSEIPSYTLESISERPTCQISPGKKSVDNLYFSLELDGETFAVKPPSEIYRSGKPKKPRIYRDDEGKYYRKLDAFLSGSKVKIIEDLADRNLIALISIPIFNPSDSVWSFR